MADIKICIEVSLNVVYLFYSQLNSARFQVFFLTEMQFPG